MTPRDRELLERWTNSGDAGAFDRLVSGYSGLVYSACWRILGNSTDAEDATQECFLQLAHKTPQIETSLGAWLHTVATRRAKNRVRQESRLKRRERAYSEENSMTVEATWDDIQEFIDEALETLPDELRVPVVASFLERKTHAEIARELDVDRSTVTRRVEKGIDAIRDTLKEKGVIASSASLATMLTSNLAQAVPGGLAATLGKIAIAGESVVVREAVREGGLSGSLFAAKGLFALASLIVLTAVYWVATLERNPEMPDLEVEPLVFATPEREFVEEPLPRLAIPMEAEAKDEPAEIDEAVVEEVVVEAAAVAEPVPEEEIFTAPIAGRVYDAATNEGLAEVEVQIYSLADYEENRKTEVHTLGSGGTQFTTVQSVPSEELRSPSLTTLTNADGSYVVEGIEEGQYVVATEEVAGYPKTKRITRPLPLEISESNPARQVINIPLTRGGIMTGVAYLGAEPLKNATITFMTYSAGKTIDIPSVQTDSRGRYRIEGLEEFTGSLIPRRAQPNGEWQHALAVMAEIRYNEISDVTFDFVTGTSKIEGTIYYENTQSPIQSRIWIYFGWMVDGVYDEDIIKTTSDEKGHYLAEGLPAGDAEIHVFPKDVGGGIERIEVVKLKDGEHAHKDILISSVAIHSEVRNIPPGTKELFVLAHPGEVEVKLDNYANFMAARDSMVGLSQNRPGSVSTLNTLMKGLKPGRYTITASAWPVIYSLGTVQAYGFDNLFRDMRNVSEFVTITETDKDIDLVLELPLK